MQHLFRSFSHALRGLHYVWKEETNFQIHSVAAIAVILAAFLFDFSTLDICLVTLAIALVLGSELLNTIVEDTLDEIHPQHHKVVGKVKDMTAAIVLINSLAAAIVGVTVLVHRFGG